MALDEAVGVQVDPPGLLNELAGEDGMLWNARHLMMGNMARSYGKEALVDKLELIIDDLAAHGHPDAHLVIMSGFRTPEYNARGIGGRGGRARDSRHQFGVAWIQTNRRESPPNARAQVSKRPS